MTQEEKAARLKFTEADLKALAWVPPGPDPPEVQAERGVAWARELVQRRAQHGSHTVDPNGYCRPCERRYPREPQA